MLKPKFFLNVREAPRYLQCKFYYYHPFPNRGNHKCCYQRTIVCVSKTCCKNDKRLLSDQEHWSCYLQTLEVGGNDWVVDNILFSAVQLWNDFGATLVVVLLVYVLKAGTKNFSSNNMFSNAPWWARNCTERITFKSKLCWFNHNFNLKSHW